jgi:hypothetical protein
MMQSREYIVYHHSSRFKGSVQLHLTTFHDALARRSRRLMTAVIHALDTVGWTIYMSCDLSKQEADKVSHIPLPLYTTRHQHLVEPE